MAEFFVTAKKGYIETNRGPMPIADYLDYQAWTAGYDSYEELLAAGYSVAGFENIKEECFV